MVEGREIRRVGVIANAWKPKVKAFLKGFAERLKQMGLSCVFSEDLRAVCEGKGAFVAVETLGAHSDLLVALGGDGTILRAAQVTRFCDVPILGVNLGRLGFLAGVGVEEVEEALERVIRGAYRIERRMAMTAKVSGDDEELFALNDVVLEKGASARMLEVEITVGEEFVSLYLADGLILSTSTGSTAYSMSAGGPIVHPAMDALIITPICPHSLSVRPMLVSAEGTVWVRMRSNRGDPIQLTVDGQAGRMLRSEDRVRIRRSTHRVPLITFDEQSFYKVLRTKLMWGVGEKRLSQRVSLTCSEEEPLC